MSEFDSASAVSKSSVNKLAALMAAGRERDRLWRTDELAAIFQHQMSAPVLVDLGGFDAGTAARLKHLSRTQSLVWRSFADLFHHPSPPVEALELVKDFAKANMDHPESCLPREIAAVLYYTSIAAALVRLGTRITRLGNADLKQGLLRAKSLVWLDADTGKLLDQALEKMADDGGRDDTVS